MPSLSLFFERRAKEWKGPETEDGWTCTVGTSAGRGPIQRLRRSPLFNPRSPEAFSCHSFGGALLSSGVIGKRTSLGGKCNFTPPPPLILPGRLCASASNSSSCSVEMGSVGVERQTASRRAISLLSAFPFTRPFAALLGVFPLAAPSPGPLSFSSTLRRRSHCRLSPRYQDAAGLHIELSVTAPSLHSSHCHGC